MDFYNKNSDRQGQTHFQIINIQRCCKRSVSVNQPDQMPHCPERLNILVSRKIIPTIPAPGLFYNKERQIKASTKPRIGLLPGISAREAFGASYQEEYNKD